MIVLVCLIVALVAFALGAAGVSSRVSWDQLGKCALVGALIAAQYGGR